MSNKKNAIHNLPSASTSPGGGNPHWVKGVSGNPGGMTRAHQRSRNILGTLIAQSTDHGKEIVDFAVNVLRGLEEGCEDSKSRRWAADFLADRLWGRAPMHVTVTPGEPVVIPDMTAVPLDELRRLAAGEMESDQAEADDEPPDGDVH